jgi:cold shock CspA family protein
MIGFVRRIIKTGDYCFIGVPGEELDYFAHIKDFPNHLDMQQGRRVQFKPAPPHPGEVSLRPFVNPSARNVVAVEQHRTEAA